MTDVIMPKMGDAMEEGTLVEWLKKDGEKVKSGEVIGTIQTDKATLELEAPTSGILSGFLIQGGQTVPVGRAIATILKDGETLPADWGKDRSSVQPQPSPEAPARAQAPVPTLETVNTPAQTPAAAATTPGERVKASPLAKRIASELGIELGSISGTGPGGRIVERDLQQAATKKSAPALAQTPAVAGDQSISLNRLRQITAQKTAQSKQQVPHFYVTVEVDLEQIMALREMFEADGTDKPSVNDFVIKASAHALMDMPVVNSEFQGSTLLQHGTVNIGMAVAIDEGLTVPVLKNAETLSLRQISIASKDLARKARENKLSLDELTGNTFAISNMGMLNVDSFSAIIIPPNACIVAIGTARKKPIVNEEDELEIRWRMNITGSFDHRVVDGAVGAKFMNVVREYLEAPTRLLG